MIWLAWRQHRREILFTFAALAALAAVVIPIGLAMRHDFTSLGLDACAAGISTDQLIKPGPNPCNDHFNVFNQKWRTLSLFGILFLFLPVLVGLFWGAPMVAREIEQGTHRLVWTQGISRRRWAAVKLGLAGSVAVAAALIYGFGVSWWFTPLTRSGSTPRFNELLFDMQGLAPVGYTLFAVAVGVVAGTIWRKVLPAMAVTLVAVIVVHALVLFARPYYQAPEEITFSVRAPGVEYNEMRGDWILATGVRDAEGNLKLSDGMIPCPASGQAENGTPCGGGGVDDGAYNWIQIQPRERFWTFQLIEAGGLTVLAAGLFLLAIRRVRRLA